jgi:osmotically-inducible protein OsmY
MLTVKSDKEIQKDVMKELDWDPQVDAIEVGVQVKDGLVTLTGTVATYAKKLAAKRAAHRVNGVLDVVNNLTVELVDPHKKADQEVAKAVRHALEWDVLVPDTKIHSTVANGYVTLDGQLDSWADKTAAEFAVERLAGVKGVDNRIEIKPKTRIDSEKIRTAIEGTLERQAEREAERIGVKVQDGFVTLTGTVRSWTEKNAVHNVAAFTPGVRRVDDLLLVDSYS